VVTIAPDETGHIAESAWQGAVDNQTALITCMHANNELGTIQQLQAVTAVAATTGALLHVDAIQSLPWLKVDVHLLGCDLCAVSAHKIYGPKGVGALYVRQGTPVAPQIVGGSQEREKRAGTENVAGIVGFGMAARLLQARRDSDAARVRELRRGLLETLLQTIPGMRIHGSGDVLPNILNFAIDGVEGPTLLMNLDRAGICASSGAACSSGSIEPSHVLRALGFSATEAASGVRLSLGRTTTTDDTDHACTMIREIANRVRSA
jgi:cysteine desulfurase